MAIVVASANLSDDDFVAAFCRCELPASCFRHGDHLRLAWIYLHSYPFTEALSEVRRGIRQYATAQGVPNLYHETITTAWVRLLATHHERNFDEFIRANEYRLNGALLHRFWTPALLSSEAARVNWVAPDVCDLPD